MWKLLVQRAASHSKLVALLVSMLLGINGPIDDQNYAVVFDAGSTGSRVHVFNFDANLELVPVVANGPMSYEFHLATMPGLSAYADDPPAAALSLKPLLEKAEGFVPTQLHPTTPVKLGATAGLRLLPGDAPEAILEAVRNMFESDSSFYFKPEWVSVIKGVEEGAYMWVSINYLLGNLGKSYPDTVGVVDLGGGSVQMSYGISDEAAAKAPPAADGEDPFVVDKIINGTNYNLYVHSYLLYGLLAGRAEILKLTEGGKGNPCITNGFVGTYKYLGISYPVSSPPTGSSMRKCHVLVRKALGVDAACTYDGCSFNGVWNGGGGPGHKNLHVASFFYDTAEEAGIVEGGMGTVRPIDYLKAAKQACSATIDNISSIFPKIDERDVGYLCLDLVYQYTMLVDGFGIHPLRKITALSQVKYKGSDAFGAAWPLGCAVDLVSSLKIQSHAVSAKI